jgi:tRNA-2-methylthio-N6-dimethylallyladenosine synthase
MPAAELGERVPDAVAQERLEALQSLLRGQTLAYHRARVGGATEVLVEGRSRRARQIAGRDPWHRVVNLEAAEFPDAAPGALVPVSIVEATPHSLLGAPIAPIRVPDAGFASGGAAIGR